MPNCTLMGQGWSEDPTTGACVFTPLTMDEWGWPGGLFDPGDALVGSTLEFDYADEFDPYQLYEEHMLLEGIVTDVDQLTETWQVGKTALTDVWTEYGLQNTASKDSALTTWNLAEAGITTQETEATDLWDIQREGIADQVISTGNLWTLEQEGITRQEGETTDLWGIESSRITGLEEEGVTSWEVQKGGLGEAWGMKKGDLGYGLGTAHREARVLGQKGRSKANIRSSGTVERAERLAKSKATRGYKKAFGQEKSAYEHALERGELDLDEVLSGLAQSRATGQEAYDAAISSFQSQREVGLENFTSAVLSLQLQSTVAQEAYDAQISALGQSRVIGQDTYDNLITSLTNALATEQINYDNAIAIGDNTLANEITNKYQALEDDIFHLRDAWASAQYTKLYELLESGIFPEGEEPYVPPVVSGCEWDCDTAYSSCISYQSGGAEGDDFNPNYQAGCQEEWLVCINDC